MSWQERLNLGIAVGVSMLPLLLMVYFLVRRKRYLPTTGWRYRLAMAGLQLGLIAALPSPLLYFALDVPVKESWLPIILRIMPTGLAAGLMAIPLLAFAQGRVRWMGIVSTVLCVALLYFTLLGLSD